MANEFWRVECVDGPQAILDAVAADGVTLHEARVTPNRWTAMVVEGNRERLSSLVLDYWGFTPHDVEVLPYPIYECSPYDATTSLAEILQEEQDACPGCKCLPGDGRTPGCVDPDGCGYWAAFSPAEVNEMRLGGHDGPPDHIIRSVN